ncbi:MAG: spore coat protein [Candidatus Levybacteria bacterium RIFCSPLOWO2_12_FULL_37_14]|nr:MAG: Glucose-1-phosphate thymidylyltransferase [Candidatus Levybacteria bacterium GW2011_GWA1_37_16]KKQ38623.1 MAG: Glucose-1-phosphate thymidylyltransferase [Candidatus Levybacteria bacterium GW2011_GWC2_37_7]KKQ42424.1 MAG: Glucose-1-phosphate thymidylyltransferase [Candidatus Levybacteria bacterium GW2011_GWB1_37_8]OGH50062.1 MAG: spore coat protein [Candidatus Levybacteria bacterium RIFCSPLOWO2_12_FULL_37_14]
MKGVILAGGLATRLRPLTFVTNKHLLPIYNKPMIYYPLEAMVRAGITDVLIITGPDHAGSFLNLLKSGKDFGLKLDYEIQEEARGIAQGISLAESFSDGERIMVVLGDNIFGYNLKNSIENFNKRERGAMVFGIEMATESKQYGVIEIGKDKKVISIEEKPEKPKSNLAQTGIYMYDNRVFQFIKKLKPSKRGELEVTDLNNCYVSEKTMECEIINWWIDAGTSHDELLRANNLIADKVKSGELK